ncbi:hypothetical protein HT105_24140, partial [Bacteroides fragilis]|nr:hypothetical protein [Bacteroides fragilis]
NPLELLVATVLSAQCTDARVNQVTPELFEEYPSCRALCRARRADLEAVLRPLGFDAECELDFRNPLELLVATVLSAQCTDARVNQVTPELFEEYPS